MFVEVKDFGLNPKNGHALLSHTFVGSFVKWWQIAFENVSLVHPVIYAKRGFYNKIIMDMKMCIIIAVAFLL